jgi:hypothetical protein
MFEASVQAKRIGKGQTIEGTIVASQDFIIDARERVPCICATADGQQTSSDAQRVNQPQRSLSQSLRAFFDCT